MAFRCTALLFRCASCLRFSNALVFPTLLRRGFSYLRPAIRYRGCVMRFRSGSNQGCAAASQVTALPFRGRSSQSSALPKQTCSMHIFSSAFRSSAEQSLCISHRCTTLPFVALRCLCPSGRSGAWLFFAVANQRHAVPLLNIAMPPLCNSNQSVSMPLLFDVEQVLSMPLHFYSLLCRCYTLPRNSSPWLFGSRRFHCFSNQLDAPP